MAICRCQEHSPIRGGYVQSVRPARPGTILCGRVGCTADALIWLKRDEVVRYNRGDRIFEGATHVAKFQGR
jgi:hypothetical protein